MWGISRVGLGQKGSGDSKANRFCGKDNERLLVVRLFSLHSTLPYRLRRSRCPRIEIGWVKYIPGSIGVAVVATGLRSPRGRWVRWALVPLATFPLNLAGESWSVLVLLNAR